MKTKQEEHFDDRIRKKLQNAEEISPLKWEQLEGKINGQKLNWLQGFLFTDLFITLFLFGYIYYAMSNNMTNNKVVNISTAKEYIYHDNTKNNLIITDTSNKKEKVQVTYLRKNQNENNNRLISDKAKASLANLIVKSKNKNKKQDVAFLGNHNINNLSLTYLSNSGKNMRTRNKAVFNSVNSSSNNSATIEAEADKISTRTNEEIFVLPIDNSDLYFLMTRADNNSPESRVISDSLLDHLPSVRVGPLSVEVYSFIPYDESKISSRNKDLSVSYLRGQQNKNNGFGAAFRYLIGRKTYFSVGMQLSKNNYKVFYNFSYEYKYWNVDSINGFILSPFDPPVPYTVYDSTLINSTKSAAVTLQINETKFQCPLMISYRFQKRRWAIEPGGGLIYTFTKKQTTVYPVLSSEESEKIKTLQPEFNSSQQFDINFTLSMIYKITGSVECYLQPYYQREINTSTTKNSAVDIQHQYTGLKAGFRINFKEK